MKAYSHEAVSGLTSFRTVTPGSTDLGIPLEEHEPDGKKIYPRALLLGTAGNVTIVGIDDTASVVQKNLAAGVWHPICARQILATTGADLVVGY